MLYIDGISLRKISEELNTQLKNKKINKIVQTSPYALSINFGKTNLILSCVSTLSLAYISDIKEENFMEENSSFSLNMKKHLLGSTLIDIQQLGYDRILVFNFSKLNELGEVKKFKLYFEPMGKHSNLILTEWDNKIIDLIKRFSLEENSLRFLFPGATYQSPTIEIKKNPEEITKSEFISEKENNSLIKNMEGIGKILAQNLDSFEKLKEILKDDISPKIFFKNNSPILATVLNIFPAEYDSVLEFDTFQQLINYYLEIKNLSNSFKLLKDKLLNVVTRDIKKVSKTLKIIANEIEDRKDFDRFREMGDILAASLYSVKKGMNKIELFNFYTEEMCEIELDPLSTPQNNLEKIYKKYNKLKKGLEFSERRFEEFTATLEYFNSVKLFIEGSDSLENLKLIEEELLTQGLIKENKKQNKKKNKKVIKELSYGKTEIDGYTVLYGRNNLENDNLTMKIAGKEEYWFHSKDIPGAHIILKSTELPADETIEKIAEFAGKLSKASLGDKITVDYTKKKYINKPKGSKPGFVTYNIFDSILIKIK